MIAIKPVVPIKAWHGDDPLELSFPKSWNVVTCKMNGHDAPKLDETALRKAFANPIGTKTIAELAAGLHLSPGRAWSLVRWMKNLTSSGRIWPML